MRWERFAGLLAVLLAGGLLLAGPPAGAEIYRWTDAQGRVHYTQDLSKVPEPEPVAHTAGGDHSEASTIGSCGPPW